MRDAVRGDRVAVGEEVVGLPGGEGGRLVGLEGLVEGEGRGGDVRERNREGTCYGNENGERQS